MSRLKEHDSDVRFQTEGTDKAVASMRVQKHAM